MLAQRNLTSNDLYRVVVERKSGGEGVYGLRDSADVVGFLNTLV